MTSEKLPEQRVIREQTVACLGRNCIFATQAFGETVQCEGAAIRLLSRTCKTEADGSPGKQQYAVYAQHCPEREAVDKGDEPVGYVVHVTDGEVRPVTAIEAAYVHQTGEDDLPISLSYGKSTLVDAPPKEVSVQPESQW